jgi:hypothetical protein
MAGVGGKRGIKGRRRWQGKEGKMVGKEREKMTREGGKWREEREKMVGKEREKMTGEGG